jgi:hypothetical protein
MSDATDEQSLLWMVEFVVPDHELAALDWAAQRVVGPRNYVTGRPWSGGEEPSTISITVRSPNGKEAMAAAIDSYRGLRETARLSEASELQISMVARVGGVPQDADEHIFEAVKMKDQQRFELAVVEAQTHFEMHVRENMKLAAEHHGRPLLKLTLQHRSWSLMDESGRQLFEALVEVPPSDFERWEEYRAHVQRRNNAVHRGTRITAHDAESSIDIVVHMVRFVERATYEALAES